jgi:hypothetical protein
VKLLDAFKLKIEKRECKKPHKKNEFREIKMSGEEISNYLYVFIKLHKEKVRLLGSNE